jgi:hypothetical protein
MVPAVFRSVAFILPQAMEGEHAGRPDFRVRNDA